VDIILPKTAGFCMGVKRAVNLALAAPKKYNKPVYTYGHLIHNPQVLARLKEIGISPLTDLSIQKPGVVIIRAHGVPPDVFTKIETAGFTILNATCPRVIEVQKIIDKYTSQGYAVIIVGDKDHPEVIGLLGHAGKKGYPANTLTALKRLPLFNRAIIVAQTTQNKNFYQTVEKWASFHHPDYLFFNTICDSTDRRQSEVLTLSKHVEAIVVIGGHSSGNTKRLAEIAKQSGIAVFHIETEAELNINDLKKFKSIGITAGASTPDWVITEVYRALAQLKETFSNNMVKLS